LGPASRLAQPFDQRTDTLAVCAIPPALFTDELTARTSGGLEGCPFPLQIGAGLRQALLGSACLLLRSRRRRVRFCSGILRGLRRTLRILRCQGRLVGSHLRGLRRPGG